MKIDTFVLGEFETNCYILRNSDSAKQCLIVDLGLGAEKLIDFLHRRKLNPVAAVLTHGHIDHIAGAAQLRAQFPSLNLYIHKLDAPMLTETSRNLSAMMAAPFATEPPDVPVEDKTIIQQAGIKLEVLHTPGHTPGGICLYAKDRGLVFTNDTLFADSIGRTDLPGSSLTQLTTSIREKLFTLPDDTIVYPGHGPKTTIAKEKTHNQFLP